MATKNMALDFYKFISDNDIEYHYRENKVYGKSVEDVIIFIPSYLAEEGVKFFEWICDEWYPCIIHNTYLCIWMNDFLESYDIEAEEIFKDKTI